MNWCDDCEPIRSFERVTVTRIEALKGEGRSGDPVRCVTIWLADDGSLIAYSDPWAEERMRTDALADQSWGARP